MSLLFTQELRDAEDDSRANIHRLMDEFVCASESVDQMCSRESR